MVGLNSKIVNSDSVPEESRRKAIVKLESLIPDDYREDYIRNRENMESRSR
ncbi:MAG TPA: hypothetical protein VMT04_02955 [Terriglobales bacterium]|nr:hypothetical protein [Terriglobales bacterium]